ncbi:MAG: hypothetical protein ACFHX7_03920 [Pseudomonadota bacterium]
MFERFLRSGLCILLGLLPGLLLADALTDPTRPPARYAPVLEPSVKARSGLLLESILISPYRRIAIINGLRVREGDAVDGSIVTRISRASVSLRDGHRTFELKKHAPPTVKQ